MAFLTVPCDAMVAEASPDKMETVMSASEKIGPYTVREYVRNGKRTGKWQVDIPGHLSDTGERCRMLLPNRKKAQGFARDLVRRDEARPAQPAPAATAPRTSAVTFRKATSDWMNAQRLAQRAGDKRQNSVETNGARAKPLTAYFGNRLVTNICFDDVQAYKAHRLEAHRQNNQGREMSRVTLNAELTVMRSILASAGITDVRPKHLRVDEIAYDLPSKAEFARIVGCLDDLRAALVRLWGEAGLRADEGFHARWTWFKRDVDGKPYVHVQKSGTWTPKTPESTRKVPISEDLYAAVMALPRTSEWVFPSPTDPTVPMSSIQKALKTACRKAGIQRDDKPAYFPPKMFRKHFGTELARARVDRTVIQKLVGHRRGSPVTDQFYVFLGEQGADEAVEHARMEPALPNLATAGNGPDSKAALRAFIRSQLAENPG
jgi:site-specific recombinase XerC